MAVYVKKLVAEGHLSKACKALCSPGVDQSTESLVPTIERLFPTSHSFPQPLPSTEPVVILSEEVQKSITSEKYGLACGPSGLRVEHLRAVLRIPRPSLKESFLETLRRFIAMVLSGVCPRSCARHFNSGKLIPLNKKDCSIRPIVVGETLRN